MTDRELNEQEISLSVSTSTGGTSGGLPPPSARKESSEKTEKKERKDKGLQKEMMEQKEKPRDKTAAHDEFETSLSRLEEIAAKLEKGDATLTESLALFEEGINLSKKCTRILDETEKKVEKLVEKDGKVAIEPLEME